jgi:hypothetical protein
MELEQLYPERRSKLAIASDRMLLLRHGPAGEVADLAFSDRTTGRAAKAHIDLRSLRVTPRREVRRTPGFESRLAPEGTCPRNRAMQSDPAGPQGRNGATRRGAARGGKGLITPAR